MQKLAEALDLPLDIRGTPFQRLVWEKIRAIPVGRTVTYTELASWVGDLSGYRWGAERKRELLRKEAAV